MSRENYVALLCVSILPLSFLLCTARKMWTAAAAELHSVSCVLRKTIRSESIDTLASWSAALWNRYCRMRKLNYVLLNWYNNRTSH